MVRRRAVPSGTEVEAAEPASAVHRFHPCRHRAEPAGIIPTGFSRRVDLMTDAATLNRTVEVGPLSIANDRPFVLIAGPCALESRAHALETSHALVELTRQLGIGLIYKSSFDKANRTSLGSARGLGLETSLPILAEVRETWGCPVLTDIHLPEQCGPVAE